MNVHRLLEQWDIQPSKGLGQNFVVDPVILERIVAAAELAASDMVLEIGAGLGTLTERLARQAGHVVAVELDQRLLPVLQSELAALDNVTLVEGDILALEPVSLIEAVSAGQSGADTPYQVVANLPYYITSAVLRHLLEARRQPRRIVVTVQREVAQRIVAQPGDMSLLAVSVQLYGRPEIRFRIKPGSFYPSPQVESAVVRIDVHDTPPVLVENSAFFRVVRAGFSQRRKQLHNTLTAGLRLPPDEVKEALREAGVDPRRRAQSLDIEEWARVTRALSGESPTTDLTPPNGMPGL
mgnify:CR=1 FL=1